MTLIFIKIQYGKLLSKVESSEWVKTSDETLWPNLSLNIKFNMKVFTIEFFSNEYRICHNIK